LESKAVGGPGIAVLINARGIALDLRRAIYGAPMRASTDSSAAEHDSLPPTR
jgi:hypothetical protein